ncbi:MAG: ABC transporter ATP-binding protein [Acetobacteraceae bacterium]|nr:ABC transporter ATP-binding protein [Acetobacteraceae bacterium]
MTEPLVSFRHVEKTYDGRVNVVQALNLDIARGEFLTLLGPSGSGKTTTLMMLAGFEAPTAGEIFLAGRSLASVPAHKRSMGMVFQNYALFPHMTVAENLAYPLRRRGMAKGAIAEALGRAVEMVKLGGLEARYPAQLSGGQQQRVAVARALIFQPDLVLMDEPLGALDKNLREQMQLELKHLHAQLGTTVVYVTHDQSEALTMSDRVAVFHEGMVQQLDTPDAMYERPANSFVANFIGENNALPGKVEGRDGDFCRVRLETGELVRATAVNTAADGRTLVSIRPERLRLWADDGAEAANRIAAKVVETIYFGDHIRLHAMAGAVPLMLKLPLGTAGFAPGQAIALACAPGHCRALDPAPDAVA